MASLLGRCRFSLQAFLLTIFAIAVVLGIVSAVARWQYANWSEHEGQVAISSLGGTYGMASAVDLRQTGEHASWLYCRLFNRVAHVDLSIDAWPVLERRRNGQPVTSIKDDDLAVLDRFVSLRSLDLHGSNVTDEAVAYLTELRSLEELDIRNTAVTEAGAAKLRSALPNCRVVR